MKDSYSSLVPRSNELNNFSYWYPKVVNCGIPMPKSLIFKVPKELEAKFFLENDDDYECIDKWIKKEIIPVLTKSQMYLLFVKNATFSGKFNAQNCMTSPSTLTDAITSINYDALCLGAGGTSEIIVRERIMHNKKKTPCIYNGLPLRSEFRVFYDFTKKKVIFTENYWRYDYVFPRLYDITDQIIFEHEKARLEQEFEKRKKEVEALVANAMKDNIFFEGPWSIDIMLENDTYYLIDMAIAESSAYFENRPK